MRTRPILFTTLVLLACESSPPEPARSEGPSGAAQQPASTATAAATATSTASAQRQSPASTAAVKPGERPRRKVSAKPVKETEPSPDDPLKGKFTLDEAVKGVAGKGSLVAEIKTELGTLSCDLFDDRAPITVANFVGLARGLRPFKDPNGEWVKKPGYDGTTFHRVIKGFMIQGGDPKGTGSGEPGYVIPDEIWEDAYHDRRGLLCMANRGPNTNGMQFFITDGAAPHLDGGYTIFGECKPDEVLEKLASVETRGDKAVKPTKIQKVTIKRVLKKDLTPGASTSAVPAAASVPAKPKSAPPPKPAASP